MDHLRTHKAGGDSIAFVGRDGKTHRPPDREKVARLIAVNLVPYRNRAMITRRTFQAGLLSAASGFGPAKADTPAIAGTWSGVLEAGSQRLRLELDIAPGSAAILFSLDQSRQPFPGRVNSSTAERIELTAMEPKPSLGVGGMVSSHPMGATT